MSEPLKIFISYSHKDKEAKNELRTRLAVMEQQESKIKIWHDNEILPGDKWYQEISTNLTGSDILLYLVSAQSLASKNCNKELGNALNFDIRVIPVILEDCDWENHKLKNFEVLPEKGKPINEWQPRSKGWQNVVSGIRKVVDTIQSQTPPPTLPDSPQQPPLQPPSQPGQQAALMLQQGNFLGMIGQIDKAIEAYSKAIHQSASMEFYKGLTHQNKGIHDKAICHYSQSIELNPNVAVCYNNRGTAYLRKGDFDNAIQDYNNAIVLSQYDTPAYCGRGEAWLHLKEWEKARSDLTAARERGLDIIASFQNDYESVKDFEQKNGVTLPSDLAAMLTRQRR